MFTDNRQQTTDNRQQTTDNRQQTTDNRQQTRIIWLDHARCLAILFVILCHATEHIYSMRAETLNQLSSQSHLFAVTMFSIGRLGVPIFLFMTGYLLLTRNFTDEKIHKFWRKNWLRLLLTTEVWIVLYRIFLAMFHYNEWGWWKLVKDMLFFTQVPMGHMWYMPMIVGLYICLPFAARALQNVNLQLLKFPLLLLGIYAFGVPVADIILRSMGHKGIGTRLDLGFIGGVYGIYLLLGFCVKQNILARLSNWQVILAFLLNFCLSIGLQIFAHLADIDYNVWYNCGFLLFSGILLFELISRYCSQKQIRIFNWISYNSFGLYLIHFPVIMLLEKHIKALSLLMPIKVFMIFILVTGISFCLCYIINKFPKLSRILLYTR